jgi:FkbM family methyltransferase
MFVKLKRNFLMSLPKINRLAKTRYGSMIYNRNDQFIGKSLELYGEWSQNELDFMGRYISEGDYCIDVGANIGTHALYFADLVGKTGCVAAFEPQRIVFQLLCANIALNQHMNVNTFNTAVTASEQIVHLPNLDPLVFNNFGAASLQPSSNTAYPVKGIPLDALSFPRLDFIKIDAEGSEPEIVRGAVELLQKHQPLVYAEYYPERHSECLIHLFRTLDYRVYMHPTPSFNPSNFNKEAKNIFGEYVEHSLFCVPKTKALGVHLERVA